MGGGLVDLAHGDPVVHLYYLLLPKLLTDSSYIPFPSGKDVYLKLSARVTRLGYF